MSHTEVEEFTLTDTGLLQTNKKIGVAFSLHAHRMFASANSGYAVRQE